MVEHLSHILTRVELFLSAHELKDRDTFTKSDPFCIVYSESSPNHFVEIGRTEIKKNDLNPSWSTTVALDFIFESKQTLKFHVFDYDESKPDDLGFVVTTLGELVGKGTSSLKLLAGNLTVRVEEQKLSREAFVFHFRGHHLDKKDTFGKSDPYLVVYKSLGDNKWGELYKSEIVQDTLDPVWKPFELSEQVLCNSDRSRAIKIEVFDWDRNSDPELIGFHETTLAHLLQPGHKFDLHTPKKTQASGTLEITEIVVKRYLTFIDYLRAGVQVSMSIAIDFTASNKEPNDPTSLHHLKEGHWNDYQKAIWEVGHILQAYDTDHLYPVFGFGGCPRQGIPTSHCFPLNENFANPYVVAVEGVLNSYYAALRVVELSGPTHFHHIINQTIAVASSTVGHSQYYVLLILTDGAIMDMQETIDSVVKASSLPISIIIVGIGNAEFDSMVTLDADKGRLKDSHGTLAVRDIVQFVPFRKYGGNAATLAAEVLKEIPSQLTAFMRHINYVPEAQAVRGGSSHHEEVKVSVHSESHHSHHSSGKTVEVVVQEGEEYHHHRHHHHKHDGTTEVTVTESHEGHVSVESEGHHSHRHRSHKADGTVEVTVVESKKEGHVSVEEGEEYHHHRHHHHHHDS